MRKMLEVRKTVIASCTASLQHLLFILFIIHSTTKKLRLRCRDF